MSGIILWVGQASCSYYKIVVSFVDEISPSSSDETPKLFPVVAGPRTLLPRACASQPLPPSTLLHLAPSPDRIHKRVTDSITVNMATQTQVRNQATLRPPSVDDNLSFPNLPRFPANIPTAPLHRLSLLKLRLDPTESERLFSSCKDLGFFYLDLRGDEEGEKLLAQADQLFELGPKLYDLGREELSKYDYKKVGSYAGYKGYGSAVVDEKGNLDRNEFYNVLSTYPPSYFKKLTKLRFQKMTSSASRTHHTLIRNFSIIAKHS